MIIFYDDDIEIIAEALEDLNKAFVPVGLSMNMNKTKIMSNACSAHFSQVRKPNTGSCRRPTWDKLSN